VYAEGAGPTVLFAHGWEGSAGDLAPIAGALLRAGFRVVLFDMPAHGRSSGRLTTLPAMARAVRAAGEWCAPVHAVVGHSLGGTAATLALRDGLGAARAVVIGAPAEPTVYLERLARLLALPEPRVAGVVGRLRALAGGDFSLVDASVAVRGLAVPGLVIHDAYDREVPCDDGRAVAAAWPSCRLVVTEGLGHRRLLADRTVVEAVVSFVTEPSTPRI
jgi:pimeloyl-ACP methyl ester carboxylesterase